MTRPLTQKASHFANLGMDLVHPSWSNALSDFQNIWKSGQKPIGDIKVFAGMSLSAFFKAAMYSLNHLSWFRSFSLYQKFLALGLDCAAHGFKSGSREYTHKVPKKQGIKTCRETQIESRWATHRLASKTHIVQTGFFSSCGLPWNSMFSSR